jgi:hypothetical protein
MGSFSLSGLPFGFFRNGLLEIKRLVSGLGLGDTAQQ